MKRINFIAVFVITLLLQNQSFAQRFHQLDDYPTDIQYLRLNDNSSPVIRVVYSRPKKKKKAVFGQQVPYDKIWRTGANEATEIKFYTDVRIGDKLVKAGRYTLQTIPGEKEWTIILNSKNDTWGTVFYNPELDVVRIKVPAKKGVPIDIFSIGFKHNYKELFMTLAWDDVRVNIPIDTGSNILAGL